MRVGSRRRLWAPARRVTQLTHYVSGLLALTAVLGTPASASAAAPSPVSRAAPAGSIGVRLLSVPVAALDDPRARLYIVDHLHPGTVIHRRIEVSNGTASTRHIVISAD